MGMDYGSMQKREGHHASRPCQEASHAFRPSAATQDRAMTDSANKTHHEQLLLEREQPPSLPKIRAPPTSQLLLSCRGCNKSFVYPPAALILKLRVEHLPVARTREQLDRLVVRRADTNNLSQTPSDCLLSSDLAL
jgi:hypothetical protein